MTPERKKKLRLLLRKKAAEELKKEQERKAAERRRIIEERCGKPKNVEDASEGMRNSSLLSLSFPHCLHNILILRSKCNILMMILSLPAARVSRHYFRWKSNLVFSHTLDLIHMYGDVSVFVSHYYSHRLMVMIS